VQTEAYHEPELHYQVRPTFGSVVNLCCWPPNKPIIERITGVEKKTILSLLLLAGERCKELMRRKIKGVAVKDLDIIKGWV
jgi:hypothetical protein